MLQSPPASHALGPQFLNVLKVTDIPAALALAAEKAKVRVTTDDAEAWKYPREVSEKLGWNSFEVTTAK